MNGHKGRDQKIRWSIRHNIQVTMDHTLLGTCNHITIYLISSHSTQSLMPLLYHEVASEAQCCNIAYHIMPYNIMPCCAMLYYSLTEHLLAPTCEAMSTAVSHSILRYPILLHHIFAVNVPAYLTV